MYECADGKYVCVGPIENKFYLQLLAELGLDPAELGAQMDVRRWPDLRCALAERFKAKSRAQWTEQLEGTDVCFAPVLDLDEACEHPHLKARGTYIEVAGVMQPAPAPRFSRTVPPKPEPPAELNAANAAAALRGWLSESDITALVAAGTVN